MATGSTVIGLVVAVAAAAVWRYLDGRHLHTLAFLGDDNPRSFNDAMLAGIVGFTAAAAAVGAFRLAAFAAVGVAALVLTLRVMNSN